MNAYIATPVPAAKNMKEPLISATVVVLVVVGGVGQIQGSGNGQSGHVGQAAQSGQGAQLHFEGHSNLSLFLKLYFLCCSGGQHHLFSNLR